VRGVQAVDRNSFAPGFPGVLRYLIVTLRHAIHNVITGSSRSDNRTSRRPGEGGMVDDHISRTRGPWPHHAALYLGRRNRIDVAQALGGYLTGQSPPVICALEVYEIFRHCTISRWSCWWQF